MSKVFAVADCGVVFLPCAAHRLQINAKLGPACRHAETHFKGSFYTIAALDGMTRKHLQNVIVDACRQSVHDCVLCLGHNKGWEEAASSFAVSLGSLPLPPCKLSCLAC